VGNQSHPVRLATTGSESCVGPRVTWAAKRRQLALRAGVIEPRNLSQPRADVVFHAEGNIEALNGLAQRSGGVQEHGTHESGVPQEPGRPCHLPPGRRTAKWEAVNVSLAISSTRKKN
jgi:hypothetical protein